MTRHRKIFHAARPTCGAGGAFTLIELLVVIAIIGLLAALLAPSLIRSRAAARSARCLHQMQQLGLAVGMFADENDDRFPRSQHSAFANGELTWGRSIARHLGSNQTQWKELLRGIYHCSADSRPASWSYGLNVFFELGPDDDYNGKPDTWRRRRDVPQPGATILFGENNSEADHIMPNFWTGPQDVADLASARHLEKANYAFVDGHSSMHPLSGVYDPVAGIDKWNPSTAR